ncbi:MAG: DUF4089 domain-containing protein [Alphaproteobacteria bacterium]|nr:DUF4089 domain-containing protein [Alphaproteobacteria bacterium]MCW5740334.1 DUF4089 domain-containing protein [Alphaproteobacteria bacterium]
MQPEDDTGTYVDAMARIIGLPIDPALRDKVIASFDIARTIAGLALAAPLPDATESAPVFEP